METPFASDDAKPSDRFTDGTPDRPVREITQFEENVYEFAAANEWAGGKYSRLQVRKLCTQLRIANLGESLLHQNRCFSCRGR